MKQFSYLVTIILIMMVAITPGFASKGSTPVKGLVPTDGQSFGKRSGTRVTTDPEVKQRFQKSSRIAASRNADAMAKSSNPIPKVDGTSKMTAGMSGTYHIPGDFATIEIAVAVINFAGISGATTWQLDNASYTEPAGALTFGDFPGAGTATLTIQPKAGVAVTVNFTPSAGEGKGFAFNNAHGITIDGLNTGGASLTLEYAGGTFPAGDAFAATIYVTGGSSDITVQNTNIEGEIETTGTFYDQTDGRPAVFVYQGGVDPNDNITITGCTITNATFGIKALSDWEDPDGLVAGKISYTYNNVGSAFGSPVGHGGIFDLVDEVHYDHNVIDGIEWVPVYWETGPTEYDGVWTFGDPSFQFDFGQPSAGHFYNILENSSISYNVVKNMQQTYEDGGFQFLVYGLLARVGAATAIQIHDNRIEGIHTTDANGNDIGLRTEYGGYHNSIRFTGTQTAGQASYPARAVAGNFYNNALSNERTGGAGNTIRCLQGTPGGTSDGNAFYSANGFISTGTIAAYFATLKDANSQYGPINFNSSLHITAGPSSAENIGRPNVTTALDIDGDSRDTSLAGTRDAGADEFANTGSSTALDVFPVSINPPVAGGVPALLAQTPVVRVKNNSLTATGSFNVRLQVSDGYDQSVAVSLAGLESKNVTFPSWTPAAPPSYTLTATTQYGSDAVTGNDVLSRAQPVSSPHPIIGSETYWTGSSANNWVGTGSWVLNNTFTKLGGPYSGYSWVTAASGGYTNATGHLLTSEFYDLSGMTGDGNLYISFYLALETEPSWDRMWVQYTTDGSTWNNLGSLNDANGVNWYSSGVYANAPGSNVSPDCWDDATANSLGLTVGPLPPPGWTSNGDCLTGSHTGPNGYIYQQLKVTPASHPALVRAPIVRFRIVAFADAGTNANGWAVDNLRIGDTAPVLLSAPLSGNVYTDTDGSGGKNGGETGVLGKILDLKYFGVHVAFDTTDANGDYSLTMGAPGTYTVNMTNNTVGLSQPATGSGYTVAYAGDATPAPGRDFGMYDGSITGRKFDDINDNGLDNAEPGLTGWTIEVHKDSCNGALVTSGTTGGTGGYVIPLGPGIYWVKEVQQAHYRATTPTCGGPIVVIGTSGSISANVAGPSFGNFKLSVIKLFLGTDQNGNGVYDGGADNFALPAAQREIFDFKHNGVHVKFDTLGNGLDFVQYDDIDTGNYTFTILGTAPAGWVRTLDFGGTYSVNITTSHQDPTPHFLDYEPVTVSGFKYEDMNGDGIFNGADAPLAGWTISLTGSSPTVTDINGNYSFTNVGGGPRTLSETVQAGWQATQPASGTYALNVTSKNLGGDIVRNFGNFEKISISGQKYRDRNGNASKDVGDNGLSGWTVNGTNGAGSQVTDVNGNYSFTNLGPGTYVISEVLQPGYTQTAPPGGTHTVVAVSGTNVTGRDFGNYQQGDSARYRTWTLAELSGATEAKAIKKPKVGKPITAPNSANLLTDLLTAPKVTMLPVIQVGLSAQLVSGKEKGYVMPAKQSDIYKTFNTKSVLHTGAAKPLSFYNDGIKRILKRVKSLPASKQNNLLMANLLTLKVNLAASAKGQTDPGLALGNLIYCEAGHAGLTGKTLSDISVYADSIMTNWDDRGLPGTPSAMWTDLNDVVAQVNAAFSTGSTSDTATDGGWFTAPKLKWALSTNTAQSTTFLCAPGPGAAPASNSGGFADGMEPVIPTVYALNNNYPNPFNPTTMLSFDLPEQSIVTLKVYNMLGQEVATLVNGEEFTAGTEEFEFDASTLTSGVYFYRITAQAIDDDGMATGNSFTATKKMMLVK